MPNSVKEIMREIKIINKNKTFFDALTLMIHEKTNSLAVVDDEGKLVGMLNAGRIIEEVIPDYLEEDAVAAHFANEEIFIEDVKKAKNSPIEKFMLKEPKSVHYNATLMEVGVMAISSSQLRIPVVDENDKPVGIITRTELKKVFGEILGIKNI